MLGRNTKPLVIETHAFLQREREAEIGGNNACVCACILNTVALKCEAGRKPIFELLGRGTVKTFQSFPFVQELGDSGKLKMDCFSG